MLYESVISVQNGQFGVRVLFTVAFEGGPYIVRDEEVITFNFSGEGEFGDTEISISVPEVVVIFRVFV